MFAEWCEPAEGIAGNALTKVAAIFTNRLALNEIGFAGDRTAPVDALGLLNPLMLRLPETLALDPLLCTPDALTLDASAFRALDPLPFDTRPFGALDPLAFNPLAACTLNTLDARPLGPLYALAFDPLALLGALDTLPLKSLWSFCTLNLLPFDARTFGALDTLSLDTLWALGPLALHPLWPFRSLGSLTLRTLGALCLAFALAGLGAFAAVTAVALGVGRAGQRQAGDASDQEKLGTHG